MTPDLFGSSSSAVLSPCGTYRYKLGRRWGSGGTVAFVMLNPSTADAAVDDPTIRRCVGFAKAWGYTGIEVRNLFALRATNPEELRRHSDPVGPDNDDVLAGLGLYPLVVAAWGAGGALCGRGARVRAQLTAAGVRLHHLGLTKAGQPRHPLYLRIDAQPILWEAS